MKRTLGGLTLAVALVATTLVWAQGLPVAKPEEVGFSAERLDRIGQVFKQEIADGRLPGAVVMVARKGKLAYSESFGFRDKATESTMPKDAIFRIYSMTKPLASVGAMILMEEGKLQLTDPVAKYLPEFAKLQVSVAKTDPYGAVSYAMVPAERGPTVQDLLRHTAGLAYGEITQNGAVKEAYAKAGLVKPGVIDYDARDLTPEEMAERLGKAPLIHQPGTRWEYSLAVDLLGRVIEKVAGKPLGAFLDERLFKPLKMVDTGFSVSSEKMTRLAAALPTDPATGQPNKLIDVTAPPKNDSGGAGAVSTAGDYLRFGQAMLNGGKLDGVQVLSRTTVALMTSDHLGPIPSTVEPGELLLGVKGYTFGLGFAVRKEQGLAGLPGSAGEFMWAGAAGTYFWIDPKEELAVVLMTQAPGPSRPYYRRELKQLVYQAIAD